MSQYDVGNFRFETFPCIFGWGCVQSFAELSYIESEEVEAVIDMSYLCFLFGKGQTPFFEELYNDRFYLVFKKFLA